MSAQRSTPAASAKAGAIAKTNPSTQLATQEEIPEHLRNTAGIGAEEMGREDILIPRVSIAQQLSPAINKKKPGYIEGLSGGELYNTVTREIYGESILFVPVLFAKSRILFEDMDAGGGIICQSANGINGGRLCPEGCDQCPKSKFQEDEAPECNKFMNYPGYVIAKKDKEYEVIGMAAVSMKSTSITEAKKWNSLIRMAGVATYGKLYKLSVVEDSRGTNDFWNWKVDPVGFTPKDIFTQCDNLYKVLKAQGVKVDMSDVADEGTDFQPANM